MNYNEFRDALIREVQDFFQNQAEVSTRIFVKNNGVEREGLMIMEDGKNCSPTIYLDDYYERFQNDVGLAEIVEEIISMYQKHTSRQMDFSFVTDFELSKKHIIFRLINKELNQDILEDIPYDDFLDLAICYVIFIQNDHFGNGMVLIRNEHMEMWGVQKEDIRREAEKNTPNLLKPYWCSLETMLEQLLLKHQQPPVTEASALYVLTNTEKYYGAGALRYPQLLQNIAEEWNSDFYIIPSSVHEVLLFKKDGTVEKDEICKMVNQVNRNVVGREEILSDTVYEFDRKSGIMHL